MRGRSRRLPKLLQFCHSFRERSSTASRYMGSQRPSLAFILDPRLSRVHLVPFRMMRHTSNPPRSLQAKGNQHIPIELELFAAVYQRALLSRQIFGTSALPTTTTRDSYTTFHSFSNGFTYERKHFLRPYQPATIDWGSLSEEFRQNFKTPDQIAYSEIHKSKTTTVEPTLDLTELNPELRAVFERDSQSEISDQEPLNTGAGCPNTNISTDPPSPSKRLLKKQCRIAQRKETRRSARDQVEATKGTFVLPSELSSGQFEGAHTARASAVVMSTETSKNPPAEGDSTLSSPAQHKPLVVGRTKPRPTSTDMESSDAKAALNHEIAENIKNNTTAAGPAEDAANLPTKKKEKAPKQPKPPKAAAPSAPLSPALIDLRVGHILRAINHPNADSLYVSTIAMGDPEGTEHTHIDEETGKVVRTVCSGLNRLIPLEEMQNRKVIVVANLKPVNMRSIKSAAMVLAASPPAEEGADPHAADRIVELVNPPEGAEAGDEVYFEGWPYGEGKGPEKTLNPKKKQWEAIQPGFYTSKDLVVGFDASKSEMAGEGKGDLIIKGKGRCTVKTLKGAVVR